MEVKRETSELCGRLAKVSEEDLYAADSSPECGNQRKDDILMVENKNRYFLVHQKYPDVWYITERDEISAWHNEIPSIMNTDCVYAAETLPDMLHQIQEAKDSRFYVELDWINDKKETRSQKYPYHIDIHVLLGYIQEVCDIETDCHPYLANWEVNYVSGLWCRDGERMTKVRYFTEKMEAAVKDYIEEQGLVFDEE